MKCYGLFNPAKLLEVPLKEIKNHVCIRGFIANVESTLTYQNNDADPIEAKFVFPMDDKSAVYKFEAVIEGRHIVAECQDKTQAKETYDDAIASGQTAMMMSEDDQTGDIFEILLGNLPPNTEAKLTLAYVTELPLDPDGSVIFTLPTVLNPRYTPAGSQPTKNVSTRYIPTSSKPYSMAFTAQIDGNYEIKEVKSKKDYLKVDKTENNRYARIELAEEFKFDHDLVLEVKYGGVEKPEIILEKNVEDGSGLLKEDVLMLNFSPEFQEESQVKGEYVFVIDRSGSMGGSRIQKAKETLLLLIKSLPPDSMFNIIGFGSHFSSLFDSSVKYDEKSLKEAMKHQKIIGADLGGTEILQPLKSVYAKKVPNEYTRQLFLLTDGDVSNTREVIALVQKNANTTRVFTFGIGEGASTSLVENVAKVSGGKATFVKDNERLQSKVISALKCAMQPSVTDIQINWNLPEGLTALNIPSKPPIVFKGERLILYAIIQGQVGKDSSMECEVTLSGKMDKKKIKHVQKFDLATSAMRDNLAPIHRLAAKGQIKELEYEDDAEGYYGEKKNKDKIVLVSTSANVVSQHTAFVGIDKERGKPVEGRSLRHNIPLMSDDPQHFRIRRNCLVKRKGRGRQSGQIKRKRLGKKCSPNLAAGSSYFEAASGKLKRKYFWSGISRFFQLPKFSWFSSSEETKRQDAEYCAVKSSTPQLSTSKKKKSKGKSAFSALSQTSATFGQDDESEEMEEEDSERKVSSAKSANDQMIELIDLQGFDGAWKISPKLASLFGKSLDDIKKGNTVQSELVWATALAVAWLQRKQSDKKDEWELIEKKALAWMSQQDLEGKSVDEVVAVASAFLFH